MAHVYTDGDPSLLLDERTQRRTVMRGFDVRFNARGTSLPKNPDTVWEAVCAFDNVHFSQLWQTDLPYLIGYFNPALHLVRRHLFLGVPATGTRLQSLVQEFWLAFHSVYRSSSLALSVLLGDPLGRGVALGPTEDAGFAHALRFDDLFSYARVLDFMACIVADVRCVTRTLCEVRSRPAKRKCDRLWGPAQCGLDAVN